MAAAFHAGKSVVVDNTNASVAVRSPLIAAARSHGATVTGYYFPTAIADTLRRNRAREGRERVPDVAVFAISKQLEPPVLEEGFDDLYRVQIDENGRTFDVAPYSR
jgi:predicted kinase